jgi:hypothetical protein
MSPVTFEDSFDYLLLSTLSIAEVDVCFSNFCEGFSGGVWEGFFVVIVARVGGLQVWGERLHVAIF